MKMCTKCGFVKPKNEFHKRPGRPGAFRSRCKTCHNAESAVWAKANPERNKILQTSWYKENPEYHKTRYANNPEPYRSSSAKWKSANPEKHREGCVTWRANNPERAHTNFVAWHKANPEACRIHNHNRRLTLKEAGGKLSNGLTKKLFKLQRGKCACCKQPLGDDYHLDHVMPLALGGTNTDKNIQLLRATCNLQKHAKHPVDFMRSRGFLL